MLKNFIRQSWLVMSAALVFGLLVAFVHGQLIARIEDNAKQKLEREMKSLLTSAGTFDAVPDKQSGKVLYYTGKDQSGQVVGYAFEAVGGGFADKIGLLVTIDANLEKLLGIAVLKSNESPGIGDKIMDAPFKDQFIGSPAKKLVVVKSGDRGVADEQIVAITGATVSSDAVVKIVNEAVKSLRTQLETQN